MKQALIKGAKFKVKGVRALGLTPKGRVMEVPFDQTCETDRNTYHNLFLLHTRGPMKGITIHFKKAKCYFVKPYEPCTCNSYSYPHKKGMGRCRQ